MRNFQTPGRDTVENFYLLNHRLQTLDFVKNQFKRFVSTPTSTRSMTWLEALTYLDTLVDDSDPDTELSQLQHLLQTAEAIRRDDHEDWFVLTGFIHDLGKILCLWENPNGLSLATLFQSVVDSAIRSYIRIFLPTIPIQIIQHTKRPLEFTNPLAVYVTSLCLGATMSTCSNTLRIIFPSPRNT